MIRLTGFMILAAVLACAPQQTPRTASVQSGTDTLRGIVRVVGSEPATWVVISPLNQSSVSVAGAAARQLEAVSGADVWVRGRSHGHYIEVELFAVREADGRPTYDGVVSRGDSGLVLELTGGGRVELRDPPRELYSRIGSRIWITQPIVGRGDNWGVIPPGT